MLMHFHENLSFPDSTTSSRRQLHDLFEAPQWHGDEAAEWPWVSLWSCLLLCFSNLHSRYPCVTSIVYPPSGSIAAVKMECGET